MTEEEKQIAILKTIPDAILLSEAAKRISAKRVHRLLPRKKIQKACVFCGEFFGVVDMRKHLPLAHPGGKRAGLKFRAHPKPVGKECLYEGCYYWGSQRSMKRHVRKYHHLKGD